MLKLKAFTLFFLLFVTSHLFGQSIENLNGYKYVFVPTLTYSYGKIDIWDISSKLRRSFSNKGFIVLTEQSSPPKEIQDDPCLLLRCSIDHTNLVTGINEVTLSLKNCKDEIVLSNIGKAMGMTQQDDYNKATKRVFAKIGDLKYKFNAQLTPQMEYPKVETTADTEVTLKNYLDSANLDDIEGIYKSYQSDKLGYYKFAIKKSDDKYIAIIIETENKVWKPGEVKAVFEPSSMSNVYSVKWYMGNKTEQETFGVIENEALLSIDFKGQEGDKRQDKFIKMYPTSANTKSTSKKPISGTGSGFFVTSSGIIATNAHVVEDASTIEITVSNELEVSNYKAKLLLIDKKNDVALLQVVDETFKELDSLPFGITDKADIGEKTFTIGYPLSSIMGKNYKVTDGIVSAKSGIADDVRYYQISVPIQPGNSGGPLFNSNGNIIGLTTLRLNPKAVGRNVENVNYAIKATYLISLMNMLPKPNVPEPTSQLSTKELKDQIKILKNYVCLIQVTK